MNYSLYIPIILAGVFIIFGVFVLIGSNERVAVMADERRDDTVELCEQVWNEPDRFNPEDGTLQEKYDYCVHYFESGLHDALITMADNNPKHQLAIFIIIPIAVTITTILIFRTSNGDKEKKYD